MDSRDQKFNYLDVRQGFNYSKLKQVRCGYIQKLKIGDNELKADLSLKNILDPETTIQVVGVLRQTEWERNKANPLILDFQITATNRQIVQALMCNMVKTDVVLQFAAFEFDPNAGGYYESFHSDNKEIAGILQQLDGGHLAIGIQDDPSHEVAIPMNYHMRIGINPKPNEEQFIHLSTGETKKVAKGWGILANSK